MPSIATASDIPDLSATYATATALTTEASTARTAESKAVPRWAPTTTYTLGQQVVSPNNDVVSAIAGFTSGASYVPANWAVSSTYGLAGARPTFATINAPWDAIRSLYNVTPTNLSTWRAARARAAGGLGSAHVSTFIDSITYGSVDPAYINSWPGRLRRMFDTAYGISGTGIVIKVGPPLIHRIHRINRSGWGSGRLSLLPDPHPGVGA